MPFGGSTPVSAGVLADRRGLCACDAATYNLSVGSPLVTGSVTRCTFGLAPSVLNVLPVNRVLGSNLPVANIMDSKPIVNIVPFGMCNSIANPTVASATAAALGVLTPMPCIPVTGTPWISASRVLLANMPIATTDSKCMCSWGGVITVTSSPAVTIQAK